VTAPGVLAGLVGEVHPATLAAWDLRAERVLVGELALAGLDSGQIGAAAALPLERHPAAERDLALVVAADVAAGDVAATLRAAGAPHLRDLILFDVYRGAPLAAAEKSLAWRVVVRADDGPLEEREVDEVVAALVAAAGRVHGARLRA
jgi:phenylalanyl-tRNA synthetase beta chain